MKNLIAYFVPHPPIIIPEIGKGEEKRIQKTISAYHKIALEIAEFKPETIIIISPHSTTYEDYFRIESGAASKGDFASFSAPQITCAVKHDQEFIKALENRASVQNFPCGTKGRQKTSIDHGTLIPLYFINKQYAKYKLARLSFSGMPFITHYNYGKLIQEIIKGEPDKRFVFIASGDLSHMLKEDGPYGYVDEGPLFDKTICDILKNGDFFELFSIDNQIIEKAGECGFRSLLVLAGVLDQTSIRPNLLSYKDTFGVGYAIASFHHQANDIKRNYGEQHEEKEAKKLTIIRRQEDEYVTLARKALENYVKFGKVMTVDSCPKEMLQQRAGVFVSIKKYDMLRGCIGTIHPTTSCLAKEIIQNAISSGTEDPRFSPVDMFELRNLVYSVDVLKEPEKITGPHQLDVKRFGVIVRHLGRSGLLLPNLEGVDTVEEQISIALQKADIKKNEPYSLERFEVIRHQ